MTQPDGVPGPACWPLSLQEGSCVGVVCPSRWAEPAWLSALAAALERRGFRVKIHPHTALRSARFAGDPAARAAALHEAFADPEMDAILCGRGGSGAGDLLERLDYGLLAKTPKPFIGFSDVTYLLMALSARAGMVTFHGPMAWNFSQKMYDPRTEDALVAVLSGAIGPFGEVMAGGRTLVPGAAEGVLIGGNLSILQSLIGTPFDWDARDKILLIEDDYVYLHQLDRMMRHLRQAGKLAGVRGVVVGESVSIYDETPETDPTKDEWYGRGWSEIVRAHVPAGVPVAFGMPCGHGRYAATLPIGARVALSCDEAGGRLRLLS